MYATVEDLKHVAVSPDQDIAQSAEAYSAVYGIASSLIAIVKSPSCGFEEKKCKLFNFVESFKTYISSKAPYRVSLTKDTNGFEYFVFIATLGVYSIDIALYKDVCGWVLLTDGSCVRTPADKCESDTAYAVSVRKSSCVPSSPDTIDCGNCILIYAYDGCSDECKIHSYNASSAGVKITCVKKREKLVIFFDVCVEHNWLQYDFGLKCLPCGLRVKAYQDGNEIATTSCFEPIYAQQEHDTHLRLVLINDCDEVVSEDEQNVSCSCSC
jgi:hypothetical protein